MEFKVRLFWGANVSRFTVFARAQNSCQAHFAVFFLFYFQEINGETLTMSGDVCKFCTEPVSDIIGKKFSEL